MTETIKWNGVLYHIRLPSSATGGRLSIFESEDFPGYGPPRHIHHDADETFVVIEGQVDFLLHGAVTPHGPGDVVFVPRGAEHTFCVRGDKAARMMTIMTPGGLEGFFREMADGGYRIPEDLAQIAAISGKYSQELTGPPLT